MYTHENFTYGEIMLEQVLKHYDIYVDGMPLPSADAVMSGTAKAVILAHFMDVGCMFDGWWKR
jgi:hypothetical protein